MLIVTLVVR